jgi:serralysin
MSSINVSRIRRTHLAVERLEDRDLLSGLQPTDADQYLLEQINDARANPAAFGAAHGIRLGGIVPRQPLAFDLRLVAVAHHFASAGFGPLDVNAYKAAIRATGYHFFEPHSITVNEAALNGFVVGMEQDALDQLVAVLVGLEEGRSPLLGTPKPFPGSTATPQLYREVGIDFAHLTAIGVAVQPVDNQPRITGAVFHDVNGNGQYDLGEGLSGVTIAVSGRRAVPAFASGGFTVVLPRAGTFQVTASGGGLAAPITQTVHVRADRNVRLEFAVP